jgi:hypothetical protein
MTDHGTAQAGDLVSEDLRKGLPDFELSSFALEEDLSPAQGVEVVAWRATLKLVREVRGVPARDEALPLRGVTFVKRAPDGTPSFRRYIDWLDLFNRLGLNGAMRPVGVAPSAGGPAAGR